MHDIIVQSGQSCHLTLSCSYTKFLSRFNGEITCRLDYMAISITGQRQTVLPGLD